MPNAITISILTRALESAVFAGVFALLFFNALSGVRDESSDVDNQFYAQVCSMKSWS